METVRTVRDHSGVRIGTDRGRHRRHQRGRPDRQGSRRCMTIEGLDYVSCSPSRVPVARLEAGRAALGTP